MGQRQKKMYFIAVSFYCYGMLGIQEQFNTKSRTLYVLWALAGNVVDDLVEGYFFASTFRILPSIHTSR